MHLILTYVSYKMQLFWIDDGEKVVYLNHASKNIRLSFAQ
jgi:hypothetical protein